MLASSNNKAIREDMKRLEILHLKTPKRYTIGKRPREFTQELTKMAETRKPGEVADMEESWSLPNNSKWKLPSSLNSRGR